jgi:hypothetical protein
MTFYEVIGELLKRAATLTADDTTGGDEMPFQLHSLHVFLRRIGAIWPLLMDCARQENALLSEGYASALQKLERDGVATPNHLPREFEQEDPVRLYREIIEAAQLLMDFIDENGDKPWYSNARAPMWRALVDSAEVQGRIADAALSA